MKQKRLLSMLVLLAAVVSGAWAQTETLLTTITATAKEQASYSTANVATVSFSYTSYGSSAYLANWGWWGYGWTATVTAAEGYTITKCIFYDDADRTATDSEAPFVVETTDEDKTPRINGTPIDGGNQWSKGIKKIEVYGYVTPATSAGYTVSLKDGVKDADKWTVKAGTDGSFQSLPLKGVKAGTKVKLKYDGDRSMLKGVTATSDAKPAATVKTITIAADFHTSGNIATAPEITIEYNEGEKWSDVAARYDWLKTYEDFTVYYYADSKSGDLHTADGGVKPSDLVDPNKSYYWGFE